MATQGGGNNTQPQVDISYTSTGYAREIENLKKLEKIIGDIKKDLGNITLPEIKGLKGALTEIESLRHSINTLQAGGQKVAPQDVVTKKAYHTGLEEGLKLQRQEAELTKKQLQNKAYLGILTKDEIKEQSKNLEYLKAINKGLEQRQQAGHATDKTLKTLASKHIKSLEEGIKLERETQNRKKLQERVEQQVLAKRYAREAVEGKLNKVDLKSQIAKSDLTQLRAFERAMNAEKLKAGYIETPQVKEFSKQVSNRIKAETAPKVDLKASDIVQKIAAGKFEQAEVNHAIAQLRKQLTHATNTGADRKTLVDLHEGLINVKKAAAKKFTPQSPYQVAKGLEETKAEQVLTNRLNATSIATATKAQIQEQLKASEVMGHKTKAPFGSKEYDQEKAYQELLRGRLQILKQLEAEEKKKEALAKIRSENQLSRIKSEMRATDDVRQLKILQRQLATRIAAEFKADPKSTVLPFAEGIKAQIAEKIKSVSTPKEISDLNRQAQDLKINNADTIAKNRQTAADKAAQRALDNEAKATALLDGRFKTEQQIADLKPHELKFAKDTLNFGIQTGKLKGQERLEAEKYLEVIKQREGIERKLAQGNQNIANLAKAGKYASPADLAGLDKHELDIARKVIAHRMRNNQLTHEQLINEQKLLDQAKSRDHLLTAQAHRQDAARQNERRLNQLTHLEGDGGASMAIVQAGFMMRSQVLGGLSSIFSGAFDSAIQLDKAFRNLQAISASTNYEMATMKVNLINVAQASKFSASEVGETAVMLAQAGLSIQEIGASMKGIITLAQATGTDLAKSVDVVTSVLSIFNKSATETDTIVNQLTAALNESKLDINKMALGLQYAGNIASDSGVSFEELTAALGATANAGIRSGSTLGTGLRQMFIDLQKPNEKLTKRLETLGITLDQVSFRSQGLEGVLRNLRNAGFSSADAFETFEVRSAAAFSALSGNLTDFHDLQEELADTNAAFEANNVQMESFAVQIDHLKSNLGILSAEALKPVLSLLRDMTKGMAHAMENTEEGVGVVKLLTGAFAALTVGVTIAWFARLVAGLISTTLALTTVGGALTLTRYGVIGLTAALITGIASWVSYNSEAKRLNTELDKSKGLHNELKASLQSAEGTMHNVDEAIKNLVNRYGVLKTDSRQTEAAAKSLMAQFAEFGLKIDDVANISIDNLINKMSELRTEMAKEYKTKLDEEAAAKIKRLSDEREAADDRSQKATLAGRDFGGSAYTVTREGLKSFAEATSATKLENRGRYLGSMTQREAAIASQPAVRGLIIKYMEGLLATQEKGEILPPTLFSPAEINKDIQAALAKAPKDKLSPTQRRLIEEVVTGLVTQYQDTKTILNTSDEISKTEKNLKQDQDKLDMNLSFYSVTGEGTKMQNISKTYREGLETVSNTKGINYVEQLKRQRTIAEKAKKDSDTLIKGLEAQKDLAKANKADDHVIRILEDQIATLKTEQHDFRKFGADLDAKARKLQLQRLGYELEAAKDAVATAKTAVLKTTGLNSEEKLYRVYEDKLVAQQRVEDRINALKLLDNPEESLAIEAIGRSRVSEAAKRAIERESYRKGITDNANAAANTNLNTADKARLDAKKKDLEDFYKGIKNQEKTLEARQEAERFQATAKTYRPLTTGNMFDQLNTDDKKDAQAKANATGVSQEYSVFGQAKGAFSRQAARFDNESLQKKQVQEKLALETAILFDLQQRKQNLGIEEYNKLKAEQITLEAEVTRLNNIAADARADKHPEELKLAEEALQRNKDAIEYHREAEERLTQDIETRNNTIENLKDNLQALIDKYDLLDTTMSSGVQSMTSGLSSIFSDWASGVIQNTDDVKEAFRSLGQSVLQSMAKVVSDRIAQQFMGFLLNGLGGMFGGSGEINLGMGPPKTSFAATGGLITTSGVKHFARGGEVGGTNIGRDSVAALLQPNEYVVQRSAVQALGTDFMQNLNNVTTGSLKQGAANLGGSKPMVQNVMKSSPPVNVYVVSPEQQRQMSQQDVVVALQDDILRGGATKKLIKAVITGEI